MGLFFDPIKRQLPEKCFNFYLSLLRVILRLTLWLSIALSDLFCACSAQSSQAECISSAWQSYSLSWPDRKWPLKMACMFFPHLAVIVALLKAHIVRQIEHLSGWGEISNYPSVICLLLKKFLMLPLKLLLRWEGPRFALLRIAMAATLCLSSICNATSNSFWLQIIKIINWMCLSEHSTPPGSLFSNMRPSHYLA